ncbi:hypothetical protein [Halorarum salinum]|uniref:hypothetical protein n=1 Tax=Halorarum salinum TaxID=2743089 RepID=UPI001C52DE2C|nr:hypothetical protein [Halobaculum salinum]
MNGRNVVEIDGYHRVQPGSKPAEYRRVVVDLLEEQARKLAEQLTDVVAEWDAEPSASEP